jgi:hypothetical protein
MMRTRRTPRTEASSTTMTMPSLAARRAPRFGMPLASVEQRPAMVVMPSAASGSIPSSPVI